MAIHTLAPKIRQRDLRQGAETLVQLIKSIQGLEFDPSDQESDRVDYAAMMTKVEAALDASLNHCNRYRREGFLRALTDLLYCAGQGCPPDLDNYDPIDLTEPAFGLRQ